jgi:hypothetical protein
VSTNQNRKRISTEDVLYLHFDRFVPKLLVVADNPILADGLDWNDLGLPVVSIDTEVVDYDGLHVILHALLGNECGGNVTKKPYRTKEGSAYGRMIRHGGKDSNSLNGCLDLPLFDVDAIEVEDGHVVALVELKHQTERTTKAQRVVIGRCRDLGIEYLEEYHDPRDYRPGGEHGFDDPFEPGESEDLRR